MIGKLLVIGAVVVGVCLLFGAGWIVSVVGAGTEAIKKGINQNMPDKIAVERAKRELKKAYKKLHALKVKAVLLKNKKAALKEKITELEKALRNHETCLKEDQKILEQGAEPVTISGKQYTLAEVNRDAILRVEECRRLKKAISDRKTTLGALSERIREAESKITTMEAKLAATSRQIDEAADKLALNRLLAEINAMTGDVDASIIVNSELVDALNELNRRVAESEVLLQPSKTKPGMIPRTRTQRTDGKALIKAYFKNAE